MCTLTTSGHVRKFLTAMRIAPDTSAAWGNSSCLKANDAPDRQTRSAMVRKRPKAKQAAAAGPSLRAAGYFRLEVLTGVLRECTLTTSGPREEIPHVNSYCSKTSDRVRKFITSQSERRTEPTISKSFSWQTIKTVDKARQARWCGNAREPSKQPPLGQVWGLLDPFACRLWRVFW